MSKKLIITLSVLLGVVAVVLILFWTLFALSTVSVSFQSTTKNLVLNEEEIVEAGEFRYGACVLFEGKKKSIEKINQKVEDNKNFAYLKVVNIETVFPNKFVIHVAEREELFAVEISGQVLICDRDFRVLNILENFTSTQSNAIKLIGLEFNNNEVKIGDFLDIKQASMKNFYSVMLENNRDYVEQIGKFKELKFGTYKDVMTSKEYISLEFTTFENKKMIVNNIDFAFSNKVQKLFAVESVLYNQKFDSEGNILDKDGKVMYVVKNKSGEYLPAGEEEENRVALNLDLLLNCAIKVDNLTLTENVNRDENDIYYSFVEIK